MMNQKNRANAHGSGLAWLRRVTAFVCTFAMLFSSCGPVLSGDTALAQYSEDYRVTSDPIYPTTPLPSLLPSATPEADPEATPIPDEYWDGQGSALTASGDGWTATLTYRTEAKIPDGAVLTLTELKGADLYNAMKSAAALLKNDADEVWRRELSNEDNHFFTASITDPDGNTVQPQAAVALTWRNTNHDSEQTYFSFGDEASRIVESADGTMHFKPYLGESFGYGATSNTQIGTVTQVHEGSDYMVTASYGPEAGFPAGTELKVREIMPGTAEYATYSGMTDEALGEDWSEITLERYFDIAFVKDGKELEPQADIDVQISFSEKIELTEEHDVAAVHIENNEATVIETETESNEAAKYDSEAIDTVAFTSDSFSVYGVVQKKRIITKVLEAGGNTYEIELSYTQEAEIPENAQLIVEEIPEGSDLWEAYRIQTAAALKADDVRLPGLYDISIVDEAGEKVKPAIPVNIAIKLLNDDTTEDIQIVHFKEEMPQELVDEAAQQAEQAAQEQPSQPETQQPEEQKVEQSQEPTEEKTEEPTEVQPQPAEPSQTIKSEQITATVEGDTVTFEAESFSVYAFAYTVDFHYEDEDGKVYEWSYPGRGTYPVTDILTTIGIEGEIINVTLRLAEGELVEGALYLTQNENGSWFLNSDVAFTDTYELAISLQGKTYYLAVTDAKNDNMYVNNENYGYLYSGGDRSSPFTSRYTRQLWNNAAPNYGDQNKYRLDAQAYNDYAFAYWNYQGNPYKIDSRINKNELIWYNDDDDHRLEAVFVEAFRGFDIDGNTNSTGKGIYKIGNTQFNGYVFVSDHKQEWINESRTNAVAFEAIPNSGYEFIGWYYYKEDQINHTWIHTDTFYDQVINPGTFAMDRNENWFLKAVFGTPAHFTVKVNGNGKLNGKYFDQEHETDKENTDLNGTEFSGVGQFTDQYRNQSRFTFGITAKPDSGYKFAFWLYTGTDGKLHQINKIDNKTIIPYDNVTLTAYFIPENENLFYYYSSDESLGTVNPNKTLTGQDGIATATSGNVFSGWFDEENHYISNSATFVASQASSSMILQAKFRPKGKVNYTITVNDENAGTVNPSGSQQSKDDGRNNNTITATPNEGYEFICWKLNGTELYQYPQTIKPDENPIYLSGGDTLQAFFQKATLVDENHSANSDIVISDARKRELQQWLKSLQNSKAISGDKTAHVVDPANRIYEIDFDTESALMDLTAGIDIAFIVDVSNSILFPANLVKTDKTIVLTQANLNKAFPDGGTYYIISDPKGTSTVYRIYRESDGIWYAVDASYDNIKRFRVEASNTYAETTYAAPYAYPIYRDASGTQRKQYMQDSIDNTLESLKDILGSITAVGGTTSDIRIAWNTFAHSLITSNDFSSLSENFEIKINQTAGGTHQDKGLSDASTFNWQGAKKYAILITDGAPNDSSASDIYNDVKRAAEALKVNKGVTLITVGLSTRNVSEGSLLLKFIASDYDNTGKKLFFEAESGSDLENVLLEVLQTIISKRIVSGDIEDVIDSAFYPVDSSGMPLAEGYYDLKGQPFVGDGESSGEERFKLSYDSSNGTWKIKYCNLRISDHNQVSILVKAKEDFLGGNKITTNKGDAVIQPTWWYDPTRSSEEPNHGWIYIGNSAESIVLNSPMVNVKELSFTYDSSEETVNKGDPVNPAEKLQLLYNNIAVEEVVSASGSDHRRTIGSQKITDNPFEPETYLLSTLIGNLTEPQWTTLIDGGVVTIPYSAYGHSDVGMIILSLTKTANVDGATVDYDEHATTAAGMPAETYTISAEYTPVSSGAATSYDKTTVNQFAGALTGKITSENVHIINVLEPTSLLIKKNWSGGSAPSGAYIDVVLGRYKLVDEQTGTGTDDPVIPVTETWTISFDAGEGSGNMTATTVTKGNKYTLPSCTFAAPSGMVFDRWDLGTPGDEIDITSDTTITALWTNDEPQYFTATLKVTGDGVPSGKSLWLLLQDVDGEFSAADSKTITSGTGVYTLRVALNDNNRDHHYQLCFGNKSDLSNMTVTGDYLINCDGDYYNIYQSNNGQRYLVNDGEYTINISSNIPSSTTHKVTIQSEFYPDANFRTYYYNHGITVKATFGNPGWNPYGDDVFFILNGVSKGKVTFNSSFTFTVNEDLIITLGGTGYSNFGNVANQLTLDPAPNTSSRQSETKRASYSWLDLLFPIAYADEASIYLAPADPALPAAPEGKKWARDNTWSSDDRTVRLNGDAWSYTKTVEATDNEGNPYVYFIDEVFEYNVDNSTWTAVKDGQIVWGDHENNDEHTNDTLSVTNTKQNQPVTVSLSITKTWADNSDVYELRPTADEYAAMVKLMNGDTEVTGYTPTVTDNEDNTYTVSYTGLPELGAGEVYSIVEDLTSLQAYETSNDTAHDDGTIVNNLKTTSISGAKTWNDNDDEDHIRPASITVHVYQNGGAEPFAAKVVTPDASGNWSYTFDDLPLKANDGGTYTYTISEVKVPGYSFTVNGNNIINTPVKGNLVVEKVLVGDDTDPEKTFTFLVKQTNEQKVKDGQYGMNGMTFINGEATFTLKGGEKITATGLPYGFTYTVTENEANEDGYVTTETVATNLSDPAEANRFISEEETETVTFTNGKYTQSNTLIIKKKWAAVINQNDMPAVHARLLYYIVGVDHPEWASSIPHKVIDDTTGEPYDIELSKNNNWTWSLPSGVNLPAKDDQGHTIRYYVDEVRETISGREKYVAFDRTTMTDEMANYRGIEMECIVTSQGTTTELTSSEPKPYQAYIEEKDGEVAGTFTITNRAPGGYIQMDVKKKFLWTDPKDGALWTTTSFTDTMTNYVIEVQLYRRAVENKDVTVNNFSSAETIVEKEGWQPYGNSFKVGYNRQGQEICISDNVFDVENDNGTWAWTINKSNHQRGLPKYGYLSDGTPVKYQYVLVEKKAYRYNENDQLVEDGDLIAVLPAVWQGTQGENVAQAQQIIMFPRIVAQDQDRLINVHAADLKITKFWKGIPQAKKVYIKVYRIAGQNYNTGDIKDYTNVINTTDSIVGSYHVAGDGVLTNTATVKNIVEINDEKYICLSDENNWTVTIDNVASASEQGAYRYWIKEVGYNDGKTDHISTLTTDEVAQFDPEYSAEGGIDTQNGFANTTGGPAIVLQKSGENHLKVENKSQAGSLQIIKVLENKNANTPTDASFTFDVTLTLPTGTNLTSSNLEITGGTISGFDHTGDVVIFVVTISGEGTATINGIPYGTQYTVVEQTPPSGWVKVGVEDYSDEAEPKTIAVTDTDVDTVTVTNTETIQITVDKKWLQADKDHSDISNTIQNASITVKLTDDGENDVTVDASGNAINPVTLNGSESPKWTYTWTNLPKNYPSGDPIIYQVVETSATINNESLTPAEAVEDQNDNTIFHLENPLPTKDVPVDKKWFQADGTEITNTISNASITVKLTDGSNDVTEDASGAAISPIMLDGTVDANETTAWAYNWTNLPKYDSTGAEISYTVVETSAKVETNVSTGTELPTANITATSDATGNHLSNTLPTKSIEVTKAWVDGLSNDWPSNIDYVTVGLYTTNGSSTVPYPNDASQVTINISRSNNQKGTFDNLPVYDDTGAAISYSIKELSVTTTGEGATTFNVADGYVTIAGVDSWQVSIADVNASDKATVTNTRVKTDIQIKKIDGKTEQPLTGASFRLERKTGTKDGAGKDLYDTVAEFTITESNGIHEITGLSDGEYQLTETSAPAGYIGLSGPITFSITKGVVGGYDSTINYVPDTKTFTIANTPGAELPATGGSGTLAYTLGGLALILLAGALWMVRKRRKA